MKLLVNVLQTDRAESTQVSSHTALDLNPPCPGSGDTRKENRLSAAGSRDRSAGCGVLEEVGKPTSGILFRVVNRRQRGP